MPEEKPDKPVQKQTFALPDICELYLSLVEEEALFVPIRRAGRPLFDGPIDEQLAEGGSLFLNPDVEKLRRDYHGTNLYQDQ